MYKKLLVPLDGSRLSEVILPYARAFAKAFEIPVELLHSIDPEDLAVLTDPRHGRNVSDVQAELTKRSSEYLEGLVLSFPRPSNVHPFVGLGPPAEQIINRGSEDGTLIAMTTRGLSGAKRWFLGSVANKVLHGASNPLLLVRATGEDGADRTVDLKRILVPLDGSTLAERVLPHATAIAKRMNLQLEFLRAYSLPVAVLAPTGYPPSAELVTGDSIRKEIEEYLKEKVQRMAAENIDEASYIIPQGDAADQIIDTAQKTPGTLVAMCTHGRSGIGRWILGSVAARVAHHAGEPVLVIRPTTEPR